MRKRVLTKVFVLAIVSLLVLFCGAARGARAQQITTVPSWVGRDYAAAVDQMGNTHISYYDQHAGNLHYAVYNGVRWQVDVIDATPYAGQYSSIALDWAGAPHVLYYDQTNRALKYAYSDGVAWHTATLDTMVDLTAYTYTSLTINDLGNPQVCYYDGKSNSFKYIWSDGLNWYTSVQSFSSYW